MLINRKVYIQKKPFLLKGNGFFYMVRYRLFTAEVCWDLSPSGGLPFEDLRGVGVVLKPMLCPLDEVEDRFVGSCLCQERLALFFLDPANGVSAIGVDG